MHWLHLLTALVAVAAVPSKRSTCKKKPTPGGSGDVAAVATPVPTMSEPSASSESPAPAVSGTPDSGGPKGPGKGSAGCGKPAPKSGMTTAGGRTIILDIPAKYESNKPARLVLAYPWGGGNEKLTASGETVGRDKWSYYGLKDQNKDQQDMIFVAVSAGTSVEQSDTMLEDLENSLCIDTTRIFSIGFSMGAFSSWNEACQRTKAFRAIAAFSSGPRTCPNAIPIMAAIGTHDVADAPGVVQAVETMAATNGCRPSGGAIKIPARGSHTHIVYDWQGCQQPTKIVVFDAGHKADPADGTENDSATNGYLPGLSYDFFNQF